MAKKKHNKKTSNNKQKTARVDDTVQQDNVVVKKRVLETLRTECCYGRGPRELFIVDRSHGDSIGNPPIHGLSGMLTPQVFKNFSPHAFDCDELENKLGINPHKDDMMLVIPHRTFLPYLFTCGDDLLEGSGCTSWYPTLCIDCAVRKNIISSAKAEQIISDATNDRNKAQDLVRSGVVDNIQDAYCYLFRVW